MTRFPSLAVMRQANADLVALVRSQLPMRFYTGERWWALFTAASLARMSDTVEALMDLMPSQRDVDAQTLLRSLYEQVVTFAWIAVDPDKRRRRWAGDASIQMLKLHNDALAFGQEILATDEIAVAKASEGMPPLTERAAEADAHWSARIDGLHPKGHLLGFRGLYLLLYRVGSRSTHGSLLTLESYLTREERRIVVHAAEPGPRVWWALVAPVFAIPLTIAAQDVRWLNEAAIREIADRATGPELNVEDP